MEILSQPVICFPLHYLRSQEPQLPRAVGDEECAAHAATVANLFDCDGRDIYAVSIDHTNSTLKSDVDVASMSEFPLDASYAILLVDRRSQHQLGDGTNKHQDLALKEQIFVLLGPDPDIYWSKCLVDADWGDCLNWSVVSLPCYSSPEPDVAQRRRISLCHNLTEPNDKNNLLESVEAVQFEVGRCTLFAHAADLRPALLALPRDPPPAARRPPDNCYSVLFKDGPLGIKLKRSTDKSIVVIGLVAGSQAEGMGIEIGDVLWSIGGRLFGDHEIAEDEFNGIGNVIKDLPRPLEIKLLRVSGVPENVGADPNTDMDSQPVGVSVNSPKIDAAMPQSVPMLSSSTTSSPSSPLPGSGLPNMQNPPSTGNEADVLRRDALSELAVKLVTKESAAKSTASENGGIAASIFGAFSRTPTAAASDASSVEFSIIKEGRTHVKSGAVELLGKSVIWNSNPSKYIILLSDVLLVTSVRGDNYVLEQVIENCTCKLNPNPNGRSADPTNLYRIDIRFPGGIIELVFRDVDSKRSWWGALVETVGASMFSNGLSTGIGWKHQCVYGTPHSAIMARDESTLRSIIQQCDSGELEYSVLDAPDDDGYTPLHYACIFRLKRISEMLLSSHVDCLIPDRNGLNALHWCAVQLDSETLEILCSRVYDVDIPDGLGRTPLYLACVEGRSVDGRTDVRALCKCIELLTASQASVQLVDKMGRSMLHYLAASLQWEAVTLLLNHGAAVNGTESNYNEYSALHYACSGFVLKTSKNELYRLMHGPGSADDQYEQIDPDNQLRTVQALLDFGAFPNCKAENASKTPLLLLIESMDVSEAQFEIVATALVSRGARLDEVKMTKESKQPLAGFGIHADVVSNLVAAESEYSQDVSVDATNLSVQ
jgi:hypothetical protein